MSKEYSVRIAPAAQTQLSELIRYITQVLQAPQAALHLLNQIDREIQSLSHFPMRFPCLEDEPWHSMGIRKMPVKSVLVYYFADELTAAVHVIAVINGRRDQLSQLSLLEIE